MAEWTLHFKYALSMTAIIDNFIRGCSDKRPFTVYCKATILNRETLMLAGTSLKVKILTFLLMLASPNCSFTFKTKCFWITYYFDKGLS